MAKSDKNSRRQLADQMRTKQQNEDRRRNFMIFGVVGIVALGLILAAAWPMIDRTLNERQFANVAVEKIGEPASVCGDIQKTDGSGTQQHVPVGTEMSYPDSPPAAGRHWERWDPMERKFYTADDRPELGLLVHNLEHGYTILWYDETIANDEEKLDLVRAIASKYKGTDNFRLRFKAVPWTDKDGEPFPEGQHVAFTHWSAKPPAPDSDKQMSGVTQYCSDVSGAALKSFMTDYPYLDSPEPNGM